MTAPIPRIVEALDDRKPTAAPINTHLRGSVLVLTAAEADDLPTPTTIRIDDHTVELTLTTEDDFNAWANWLQTDVSVYRAPHPAEGLAIYTGRARLFEIPVVIEWVEVQ